MAETFLDTPLKLSNLSAESLSKLSLISDYPLDYNIFLFKGISKTRSANHEQLKQMRSDLLSSIPEEYSSLIFHGIDPESGEMEPTTTSRLQDRLLGLLILERHRRDIEILNKMLDTNKDNDKRIALIELTSPFEYEIKSPIYKTFDGKLDEGSFMKFAILQNIEYDFEHTIDIDDEESKEDLEGSGDYQSDDDLVEVFCNDDIMNFNKIFSEKEDGIEKTQEEIVDDLFNDSRIGQVLIPLASKAILLGDDDDENDAE